MPGGSFTIKAYSGGGADILLKHSCRPASGKIVVLVRKTRSGTAVSSAVSKLSKPEVLSTADTAK